MFHNKYSGYGFCTETCAFVLIFSITIIFSQEKILFNHPALMNNKEEMNYVRDKLSEGEELRILAFERLQNWNPAGLSHTPEPREDVNCGSYSNPDNGCTEEKRDSPASYAHALQWVYTGDERHAQKAVEILTAWATTIKTHSNSNAPLEAAWTACGFARAAEIIKHTYNNVSSSDITKWESMFDNAYLPYIVDGSDANGNWEASMIESIMAIAVFKDSSQLFDAGVEMYKRRLPAYIYHSDDGDTPIPPRPDYSYEKLIGRWYDQEIFFDGLSQETCRDLGHTQYGFAALIHAAEIAYHQGIDLYSEFANRLWWGMEYHAAFLNGDPVPENLCGGQLNAVRYLPAWEIGYHHYAVRRGIEMPQTRELILNNQPEGVDHHMAWGTLTHAGVPVFDILEINPPVRSTMIGPIPYLHQNNIFTVDGKKISIRTSITSQDIPPGIYIYQKN